MCDGVTLPLDAGVEVAPCEMLEDSDVSGAARSIAPLNTSNRIRTSPVSEDTFFVRSNKVGVGRNFCTSSCGRPSNLVFRIDRSSSEVYGAKCMVLIGTDIFCGEVFGDEDDFSSK